jgi:hydrogenase expression/formation protein HypC
MCLAIPGLVQSVNKGTDPMKRTAKVSFSGLVREVNLAFVPDVKVGEYVLVHVGMALNKVDAVEAKKILDDLKVVDELVKEELAKGASAGGDV